MQCKKCGKEEVDGAIYCSGCGARLDGKIPCKSCGELNAGDNAYCIFCGTRMDGKRVCLNCGTAHEGTFCPACGQKEEKETDKPQKQKEKQGGLFKKICDVVGGGAAMLGVLFAMIFVFFIGLGLFVEGQEGAVEEMTIFHYFGEAYKEIDELSTTGMLEWFQTRMEGYDLFGCILGTVLSSVILLSVVSFGIVAIVKYAFSWVKKEENKSYGWALATIVSFLAGTALFYAYGGVDMITPQTSTKNIEVYTRFNGGAVAGIVLCAVMLGISLIFRYLSAGIGVWKSSRLAKAVCALSGLALVGVTLILLKNTFLNVGLELKSASGSNMKMYIGGGFLQMIVAMYGAIGGICTDDAVSYYGEITDSLTRMTAFGIVGQLFAIAALVIAAVALAKCVQGVRGEGKSGVLWASLTVGCTVALLVFNVLASNAAQEVFIVLVENRALSTESGTYLAYGRYGVNITAVVFSVLLLAATITRAVFAKKQK